MVLEEAFDRLGHRHRCSSSATVWIFAQQPRLSDLEQDTIEGFIRLNTRLMKDEARRQHCSDNSAAGKASRKCAEANIDQAIGIKLGQAMC